jgi:hypothetical protein
MLRIAQMSHVIRISEPIFLRLQALATPFVDTPASVIERLLDYYLETNGDSFHPKQSRIATASKTTGGSEPRIFDPSQPPDLRHTRVINAQFATYSAKKWNELVYVAHKAAYDYSGSIDKIKKISQSNIFTGKCTDKGFQYFPDLNISIQRVEANIAWRNVLHIAMQINTGVSVVMEWLDKEGATYPGERGQMIWPKN